MTGAISDTVTDAAGAADEVADALRPVSSQARAWLTGLWFLFFGFVLVSQVAGFMLGLNLASLGALLSITGLGLVTSFLLLGVAVFLFRRHPGEPVGLMLSASFIGAAGFLGPAAVFFQWLDRPELTDLMAVSWISLLVAVLPAFPDGRFVPAWGRWLTRLAFPFALFLAIEAYARSELVETLANLLALAGGALAVTTLVIRYRRTEPGLRAQQLKWAALGCGGGVALLSLAMLVSYLAYYGWIDPVWRDEAAFLFLLLRDLSFITLGAGMLASLLGLRLWDADRAIARSAAYFLMTIIIGVIWAASAAVINDFVTRQLGVTGKGTVAAISTGIALIFVAPARERVTKMVEKRLQSGVMRLKRLPDRLALWQHLDTPEAFAGRVVQAVSECLHASSCALLSFEADRYRLLAATGIDAGAIDAWVARHQPLAEVAKRDRDDQVFTLRMVLNDDDLIIGVLLLGKRTDGSTYAGGERRALFGVEAPLAAALQRIRQRTALNRATEDAIAALATRLERIERGSEIPGQSTA